MSVPTDSPGQDPAARARGFSLVELMIGLAILLGVIAPLAFAGTRGLALFQESGERLEVRARAQGTLGRAAREILGASSSGFVPAMVPPGPRWTDDLAFQRADGYAAETVALTGPIRLLRELVPGETDDGTDENGNGLIDEGRLVMVTAEGQPDEQRIVLGTGIAEILEGEVLNGIDDNGNGLIDEAGFCVAREGQLLVLRLTALKAVPDRAPIQHTETISVAIRNR